MPIGALHAMSASGDYCRLGGVGTVRGIDENSAAGAGLGASFLDGWFRVDLARGITRDGVWRLYFHLDALL
jgi:hypothetical protein